MICDPKEYIIDTVLFKRCAQRGSMLQRQHRRPCLYLHLLDSGAAS